MKVAFPELLNRIKGGLVYTAIMVAFVAGGFFYPVITLVFFALLAGGMCFELLRALKRRLPGVPVSAVLGGVVAFLALFWTNQVGPAVVWSLVLVGELAFMIGVILLIRGGPNALPSATATAGSIVYVYGAFALLGPLILFVPKGMVWLVFALLGPAVCDMTAYAGGVRFGKKTIVPRLSPKKTWSGSIAGTLGSMLFCLIFFFTCLRPSTFSDVSVFLLSLSVGLLVSVLAQVGDWTASAVKRYTGIKDFSQLILAHGGLFDRLDSFLTVLPGVFLLALWLEGVVS